MSPGWVIRGDAGRTMTSPRKPTRCLRHESAHPAAQLAPELLKKPPSRIEGAGNAGCAARTRSLACESKKHTSVVTTGTPQSTDIPCAMVLTAYSVLSPATNSSCHRRPRIKAHQPGWADFASVDLAPATGVRTTRFCRPRPPFEKAARRIWHQSAEALAKADQRRSSCAL